MIDEERQLFPFCIVWTLLPCITCLIPCVGHAAICESVTYYSVNRETSMSSLAFTSMYD
jgi:hypothetical protein